MPSSNSFIPAFILLILTYPSTSSSHHLYYDIDCNFKSDEFEYGGPVYKCEITSNLIVTERHIGISSMNGEHESGKNSADVSAMHAYYRTINFIPDFTPVTGNLVAISIVRCRLLRLRKQDLQSYLKLVNLFIPDNYLKYLEEDVFMYNPNLKLIDISGNKLTKINPKIFDNLKSLESLALKGNDCLVSAGTSKLAVADWVTKINENCQNYPEQIVARPREEYKRNVREKTSIWVTFGVTFGTFTGAVIIIALLYTFSKFVPS